MLYVRCSPGKQEFIFKEKTPHHGNGAQFTGSLSPYSGFLVSVKWDSEYKVSKELGARKNCGNDAGRICHISVSLRILILLNKHWTWSWKKKKKKQTPKKSCLCHPGRCIPQGMFLCEVKDWCFLIWQALTPLSFSLLSAPLNIKWKAPHMLGEQGTWRLKHLNKLRDIVHQSAEQRQRKGRGGKKSWRHLGPCSWKSRIIL